MRIVEQKPTFNAGKTHLAETMPTAANNARFLLNDA
jgi:hypothetical protein